MIDPTCTALWTHCAQKCVTSCDHNDPCEHPTPAWSRVTATPGITIHMGNMPTALRVTLALSGVLFILLAIAGFVFADQVLGYDGEEITDGEAGAGIIYLVLLVVTAGYGTRLVERSTDRA